MGLYARGFTSYPATLTNIHIHVLQTETVSYNFIPTPEHCHFENLDSVELDTADGVAAATHANKLTLAKA